jgi:hypothetical protein
MVLFLSPFQLLTLYRDMNVAVRGPTIFHYLKSIQLTEEDTGARPFVCKKCKRPFARQDALARHEKLHNRTGYSQCPSPPTSHASRQSICSPSSSGQLGAPDNGSAAIRGTETNPSAPVQCAHGPVEPHNSALSTDMDFDLIWPDSEELLENLASLDSSAQWQSTLGALPISIGGNEMGNNTFESSNFFHDKASSICVIPSGESHQAVHNVSEMVTSLVSLTPIDRNFTYKTSLRQSPLQLKQIRLLRFSLTNVCICSLYDLYPLSPFYTNRPLSSVNARSLYCSMQWRSGPYTLDLRTQSKR